MKTVRTKKIVTAIVQSADAVTHHVMIAIATAAAMIANVKVHAIRVANNQL